YDLQGIPVFDDDRAEPVGQRVEPVDEVSGRGGVRVIHPYAVGPACPAAGSGGVVALGGADEEAAGSLQVVDALVDEVRVRELLAGVGREPQRPDQLVLAHAEGTEEGDDVLVEIVDDVRSYECLGRSESGRHDTCDIWY